MSETQEVPEEPQTQTPPEEPPQPEDTEKDYKAASRSTADFVKAVAPKKKRGGKKVVVVLLVLVLLAGLAAAGYFLFLKKDKKQEPTQQAQTNQPQTNQSNETALSEHYVSQDLHLAIDYPSSWKKDDGTAGQLKLESPMTKLESASGDQTDAKVVITILSSGSQPPGFTANTAQAAAESEKVAYAAPTQNQRKETYLSFLSFGSGDGVDAIFITGDAGYQKGQTVPKTDVTKVEPVVAVLSFKCNGSSSCNDKLKISADAWKSNQTLQTAKSILQSLVID